MSRNNPFVAVELGGDLDVQQLRRALALMVQRHETLRTMLTDLGPEPYQRVMEYMEPPFSFIDLTEMVQRDHRMIIANNLTAGERGSEFDLVNDVLWRCMLIRVSPDVHILTLSISHLLVDGTSLVSFVQELMRHYAGEQIPNLNISIEISLSNTVDRSLKLGKSWNIGVAIYCPCAEDCRFLWTIPRRHLRWFHGQPKVSQARRRVHSFVSAAGRPL
jgi:hypothetical protein